jgi:hypothetical protein
MFRWTVLLVFVATLCVVASPAFAQSEATTTGNYMLGGSMSWSSQDTEGQSERTTVWSLAPRFMYFMANNFAVGAEVGFVGATQGDVGAATHRYLAIGQFTVPSNNPGFRFFGEAGGGFARQSLQNQTGDMIQNGWAMTGGIGAYMFVNEHVSITPAVSYVYETFGDDGAIPGMTNQTIFLRIGINGFMLP